MALDGTTNVGGDVDPTDVQPQGDGSGLDADTVDSYEGHAPTKSAHDALGIDAETVDGKNAADLEGSAVETARAMLSADQTLSTGTQTQIQLDTVDGSYESYDDGNNFDTAAYEYVAPSGGLYRVNGHIAYLNTGVTDGTEFRVRIKKNTTGVALNAENAGAASGQWMSISASLYLAAGDTLSLFGYQDSGNNVDASGSITHGTYLEVAKIA